MENILVIGSINMDLVIDVDHIPKIGETILSDTVTKFHGGKGANQAVAIGKLGGSVKIIGKLGKDENGKELIEGLKENNVGISNILFDSNEPSGLASIYVDKNGDNCIIVNSNSNKKLSCTDIKDCVEAFEDINYCVMQLEIPLEVVEYTVDYCHKKGIKTILNPAPAQKLSKEVLSKIDYLIPNETELELLTGNSIKDYKDITNAMNELHNLGVKNIITTIGHKGSVYSNGKEIKFFQAIKVNAVDATAAGDSFIGAFVTSLSQGKDEIEAIEYSSYVGALTVSKKGAQTSLPSKEEVEKFISQYK
ncbi:ribokinase [Clostridium algidicarnis]|uniref:ribokinase n=1 Tax=Clostridium algidicarnis TaxID=37659 RepID=UPI003FD737BA